MNKWLFERRFNRFDVIGMCVATAFVATDHFFIGISISIVGAILSSIGERRF